MKPTERLGEAHTPDGTRLELLRHDGAYLIRADGVELMSTRRHLSEDRLAEVACAPLAGVSGARALIGGLGLGFTLRAALRVLGPDAEVVVAELVDAVIAWNANPDYALSAEAMNDSRTRVVHDDVSKVLAENAGGFDAIMLDTDNGPDGMLMSENAALYAMEGIARTVAALRPPGLIVYWSVGDDNRFVKALRRSNLTVETLRVRVHPTAGAKHVLYAARPAARATPSAVTARAIHVHGMVQGVGFRVFVHRLARSRGLAGWVLNAGEGVEIHVEGEPAALDDFMHDLRTTAPPAAVVRSIDVSETPPMRASGFEIRKSRAR